MGAIFAKVLPILKGFLGTTAAGATSFAGTFLVIVVLLNVLTSLLLKLASSLIDVALDFNSQIVASSFVSGGYQIVLGLANMGFIVALAVIAFATMLRQENFGYKKALPKLIIAALLINFGLFIVTNAFINPVNSIVDELRKATNFGETTFWDVFDPRGQLRELSMGVSGSSQNIASLLSGGPEAVNSGDGYVAGIQEIKPRYLAELIVDENAGKSSQPQPPAPMSDPQSSQQEESDAPKIPGLVQTIGSFLAETIMNVVLSFIGIIALFAFAIMMFIRGITLSFLIILLPLAWAGLIFPNLKIPGGGNPWKVWWENFIRWLLFAPFAMFFFFLAIQMTQGHLGDLVPGSPDNFAIRFGQMLAVVGFMLGGLMVSNKMGITGAGYALGVATAGKVWAQAKLKTGAINLGHRALMGTLEDEKALKPWTNKALALGKNVKGWKGFFARPTGAPIRNLTRKAVQATDVLEGARIATAIAKAKAGAPYREEAMMAGLSEFEQYAVAEDLLDNGYAWENKAFWRLVTAAGLDPGKLKRMGFRRLEIKLNDAGLNIEAVAAVKPLEDYEMTEIRPDIEKKVRDKMRGKPEKDISKAIEEEVATEIKRLEGIPDSKLNQLKTGIEWNKREQMKGMINILKTSEIPKMEKRLSSNHKGYYGNKSQLSHNTYGGNLRSVISEVRPQAMSGARNNSRGDGVVNWDITTEEGIKRENEHLITTKMRVEGMARADAEIRVEEWGSKEKINFIQNNSVEVARTVKSAQEEIAKRLIEAAIDLKTGAPLSAEAKKKLVEAEQAKINAVEDIDVARLTASTIQNLYKVRRGGLLISALIAEEA